MTSRYIFLIASFLIVIHVYGPVYGKSLKKQQAENYCFSCVEAIVTKNVHELLVAITKRIQELMPESDESTIVQHKKEEKEEKEGKEDKGKKEIRRNDSKYIFFRKGWAGLCLAVLGNVDCEQQKRK